MVAAAPGVFHKYNRRAVFYSLVFVLGAILYGYDGTYFTGILEMDAFKRDYGTLVNGEMVIKSGDQSLYASIVQVGEVVGSLSAGLIGDKIGRKGAMYVAIFWVLIGAILQIIVVGSRPLIVVGRLILGVGVGIVSNCTTLYLSEICPAAIRGTIVSSWQLFLAIGQVIGAGVSQGTKDYSSTFSYRFPIALNVAIVIIIFAGMFIVPESPRWLISKDRIEEAEHALDRVNKSNETADNAREIRVMLDAKAAEAAESGGESRWGDLLKGAQKKKLFGAFGILVCQQINGVQFVFSYSTVFFKQIGVGNPFTITMVCNVVEVVGVLCSFFIINRFGRRPLLVWSALAMAVLMIVMGILGTIPNPTGSVNSAIASMIIIFVWVFNLAWGGLAWTVANELASGRNRTKILAVSTAAFWVSAWAVTFTLPYLANDDGGAGLNAKVGYIYGGGALIGAAFVYFYIPETLGRSLEEINLMIELKVPTLAWPEYKTTIDGVHNEQWKAEDKNIQQGQRFVENADAEKGMARRDSDDAFTAPTKF
ncbi:sugar transporter [Phaffia rhodozyma]|uniref:Sugar transporter n=1 Tax=Phaffia rhodozyma TaxID=264483 RepID=A0A0F7SGX7_PHARH|nr:sugar transporter [Phaffia rhodozyma]